MANNAPQKPIVPTEGEITRRLEYDYSADCARAKELTKALLSIVEKHPDQLPDQRTADAAGHNLALVGDFAKNVDDRRKAETKPYRDGQAVINRWFEAHVTDRLLRPQAKVKALQNAWGAEQRRRVQEEARKWREHAAAEAKRAAEEAARALERGDAGASDMVAIAGRAAADLDEALGAGSASAAEQTRRRGADGTLSTGTVTWKPKLVNFDAVPEEYLLPPAQRIDWRRVNDAMRARDFDGKKTGTKGKPTAVIPGIEWAEEFAMRNR